MIRVKYSQITILLAPNLLTKINILFHCHDFSDDNEGVEMLRNLTRINKPLRITLEQMMRLITQCDLLDPHQVNLNELRLRTLDGAADSNGISPTVSTSNSLYSGILPGKTRLDRLIRLHKT